jgi:hypothetical protein
MPTDLEQFHSEFFQEVLNSAHADGRYNEDAFFEVVTQHLVDAGEIDTADRAFYAGARGIRVDGYGGDPADAEGVLSLIISDFHQADDVRTLTGTEMDAIFNRVQQFVVRSLDAGFRNGLEESGAAFGLADLIAARWSSIAKIRLFLISNRALSTRVDGRSAGLLQHTEVTYSVWDLGRLQRFVESGHGRETIEIDLDEIGGACSALPAHLDGADYQAYLVVVPGTQLAAVYDRWGARLLEQNVRCFLQAKGNVNKGIRNTIDSSPDMFFAYNNGITATAESVETEDGGAGVLIRRIHNLQIVNGGQTTASLHAASRRKADLSRVFVQMKLSIIPPERALEVVPRISEYANSQNRVNAADFFANHPFHVRVEEFSRRIFAPSRDGSFQQTKWFYERARGQYQDAKAYLSKAEKKKFELEFPRSQLISKTDLAKYLNVWRGFPHIVSQGAQKNFAHFAGAIGKEWEKQSDAFNEAFYRESVAKAIVFRGTEALVSQQSWYEGGYRANVVAYAIAKLAIAVGETGHNVNYEAIWRRQGISDALRLALTIVAEEVHEVITNPTAGISNVTEWAKKVGCWERVADLRVILPPEFLLELMGADDRRHHHRTAVKEQKLLNGVEAMMEVHRLGAPFWMKVREWGSERKLLSVRELDIFSLAASPDMVPSEKQSVILIKALNRLRTEGCTISE